VLFSRKERRTNSGSDSLISDDDSTRPIPGPSKGKLSAQLRREDSDTTKAA